MVGIIFALKVAMFALCLGAILSIIILVPLFIYSLPYCFWVGSQNCAGRYLETKNDGFFRNVRNATRLYKAWITHTEPKF